MLTFAASTPLVNVTGLAITPDGKSLYATQAGQTNLVNQFDIDQTTGALTPKTPASYMFPDGSGQSMAVSPNGSSLYVTNATGTIEQLNIDATTGVLSAKNPARVTGSSAKNGIVVSPDGSSVYAPGFNSVLQFDVSAGAC